MESQSLDPVAQLQQLQRPEGNEPPADRNFDDSYTLDKESIKSIGPYNWLDDGVINAFLRSLCLARPGQCVTFDSTPLKVLQATVEYAEATSLTQTALNEDYKPFRTLVATVTGNKGLVFMPFCIQDHWLLAVADFKKELIRVYDSMAFTDGTGKIIPSDLVRRILPCVRGTLTFCIGEYQWPVEYMWLPIKPNVTECGVYICLMALQHAYEPGFMPDNYVAQFHDWNGNWSYYELDECYWLAGRKIILEVCRRRFKPNPDGTLRTDVLVAQNIDEEFRRCFDYPSRVIMPISLATPYYKARSKTLRRVLYGLQWAISSIRNLDSTQYLWLNEEVQRRALQVVLTPLGAPFVNEIVAEAASYALHDVEALHNLHVDLSHAHDRLNQENTFGLDRLEVRMAWAAPEAQRGRTVENAEQRPSVTNHGSPSSPDKKDSAESWQF